MGFKSLELYRPVSQELHQPPTYRVTLDWNGGPCDTVLYSKQIVSQHLNWKVLMEMHIFKEWKHVKESPVWNSGPENDWINRRKSETEKRYRLQLLCNTKEVINPSTQMWIKAIVADPRDHCLVQSRKNTITSCVQGIIDDRGITAVSVSGDQPAPNIAHIIINDGVSTYSHIDQGRPQTT